MDPALLDLVWEVYQKSGSRKPIKVISGYRSPRTNNMLRRRGRKVAKKSQHTRGKALDFFLQDVSVAKLRSLGLKAHRGGVGYYAGSFVHLDTGSVRHWPRMSHSQLSRVFPKGKTIHVPSNGKPLKGYRVARANLKRGLNADGSKRTTKVRKTLLASLFNNRASSADEDEGGAAVRRRAEKRPKLTKPVKAASLQRKRPKPKGPDPFSLENKAVGKQPKEDQTVQAQLDLGRIAVPRQRPRQSPVADSAVILAAAAPSTPETVEAPTQLALAAPAAIPDTLRPSVEIPQASPSPSSSPSSSPLPPQLVGSTEAQPEVDALKSRIETALARGRIQTPAETAAELQSNSKLAAAMKYIPVPSKPADNPGSRSVEQPQVTRLALAAIPQSAPRNVNFLVAPNPPKSRPKPVVDSSRFETETPVDPTAPSSRPTLSEDLIAASANRLRVPLPSINPIRNDQPAVIASSGDTTASDEAYALRLGDLDGGSVKKWAVSLSTRVGPGAVLTAPNYRQSTQQIVPKRVFSAGFAAARFALRADRFSGRALTRVAFAKFD